MRTLGTLPSTESIPRVVEGAQGDKGGGGLGPGTSEPCALGEADGDDSSISGVDGGTLGSGF